MPDDYEDQVAWLRQHGGKEKVPRSAAAQPTSTLSKAKRG